MKTYVKDMTTGEPAGLLLSFMAPMVVGNIFQQLYNLVDSMIVGQYVGADALAAVGSTGSVTYLFFALCLGTVRGMKPGSKRRLRTAPILWLRSAS